MSAGFRNFDKYKSQVKPVRATNEVSPPANNTVSQTTSNNNSNNEVQEDKHESERPAKSQR